MKFSEILIPTLRDDPKDADNISAKLMIRSGMIRKLASGLYDWLPLGMRVLKKAEKIIREEMNAVGGQEVWLPHIQPRELWEETGRWQIYGKELLRIKDRKETDFCFAPTAEEVMTDLVRRDVRSYRQLPVMLYQFGTKFRDEIRPRFGVMRAREFYMKDAYSFHANETDAEKHYWTMADAYKKIFTRCGFNFRPVSADSGVIGGCFSHEFMVLAETGEEEIYSCAKLECGYAANKEFHVKIAKGDSCPQCAGSLRLSKGIEVGHTFKLGTKYSSAMNAVFLDEKGNSISMVMGCYGIGVSRVIAAGIEQNFDAAGIIWKGELAPFQAVIVPIDFDEPKTKEWCVEIERGLQALGIETLLDNRMDRAGVKFKDADLIGVPLRITIGERGIEKGTVELKRRDEADHRIIPKNEIVPRVKQALDELSRL